MKWMGGWSVDEYEDAPADLTDEIVAMMIAEHERYEDARRGRNGGVATQPSSPEPEVVGLPAAAFVDPRTGHEVVTKHMDDGTIVQHRKIEDGEKILWALTGKKPKSFEGKL